MKLYATTTSERGKPSGKGGLERLEIDLQIEKDTKTRPIVANLNMFWNKEKREYLITFIPLGLQEIKTNQSGKAIALPNLTRRWTISA